ncbi:MAG: NADH-quinone oxidoreductase subunit NuoN [Gammaproteobacteria bacterium]|jgi:NADH-quinone oxidoreductase subunit N|nr:NADH-quinone oxidoreductase subunit NuoN [Gammaproteobacteria bacterium]
MHMDLASLAPALPEIVLLAAACAILVLDLFLTEQRRHLTYVLSLVALVAAVAATIWVGGGPREVVFHGNYVRDPMSDALKISVFLVTLLGFVYSRGYLVARRLFKGEFYVLGLFAALGMSVIASAASFLTAYLGLELLALSLYALVAFDRNATAGSEAAMKYFVLGALASGLLLYGMSMVYGATGALSFATVGQRLAVQPADQTVLVFGLVFIVIGIAFKFGAVPFHMWVPDVYHGAPAPVTLLVGSAPKIAAFALAFRLLSDGLGPLHPHWQGMLVLLAVASLALGNVVAIAQTNIKRMLAYSTISHVGFIFLGLLAGTPDGMAAAMFYAILYALMAAGAFGVIVLLSREGVEAERIDDLKGLNQRSPWYAGMMLLLMFSMAGVPPTAGFFAKLFVLDAVVDVDMVWLAVFGVFFSVIGAFYYLRVIKVMYFDAPLDEAPLRAPADAMWVLSVNGLTMLALGLFPAGLLSICVAAVS